MTNIYAIYGCGGYGREVMPLLRSYINKDSQNKNNKFYFIDDFENEELEINGHKVLSFKNFIKKFSQSKMYCCIAIADKEMRKKLTGKCLENNISMISVFSNNSLVMDKVSIGDGSVLSHFVTITSNVVIGKSFHANIYSYVGHDCIIGDFVTFAPGVKCNGNVLIENGVYIGTGAIIYPGTKKNPLIIGKNSKVAAGSVVTKNIAKNSSVIGSPAKLLTRELLRNLKNND
jgi:sugar O-acyltransferase (sialic acid O-acetyltransferase NeuD family)